MSSESVRLGILLPTRGILLRGEEAPDISVVLAMAEIAEANGCDSVWVGDSLTAKPRLEPLITLAAVAARTHRVRLGTAVLLAALRHPVGLAQAVATLDLLSQGRMVLAVGVGGTFTESQKGEWAAAGVPPLERAGRMEEMIAILRGLWSGHPVLHRGRYFRLEDVALGIRPLQRPGVPIWITCHRRAGVEAQFRRAGRLGDGYISITDSPQEYEELARKVRGYAQEGGRDPEGLESAFYMTVNLQHDETKAEEEANTFLLRYYGLNFWGDRWGPFGHSDRVISRIREYAAAGVKTVIVRFAAFDQLAQLETFVREVLPAFR